MANIGDQLLSPEAGWKRVDNTYLTFDQGFKRATGDHLYSSTQTYGRTIGATVKFKFYGTKLRLIGFFYNDRSDNIKVYIDGALDATYSEYRDSIETSGAQSLLYEKLGLTEELHEITIVNDSTTSNTTMSIDAVDVDDTGYVVAPFTGEVALQLKAPIVSAEMNYPHGTYLPPALYNSDLVSTVGTNTASMNHNATEQDPNIWTLILAEPTVVTSVIVHQTMHQVPNFGYAKTINLYGVKADDSEVLLGQYTNLPDIYSVNRFVLNCRDNTEEFVAVKIKTPEVQGSWTGNEAYSEIEVMYTKTVTFRNSLEDMQIGDYIACEYVASSGASGAFSNLGSALKGEVLKIATATPDGTFFFIKVAEGLLIADRVIQHSIKWSTLNASGFIEGSPCSPFAELVPQMTDYTVGGCTASASSELDVAYEAYKAFRLLSNVGWLSTAEDTEPTLQIQLNFAKKATKYGLVGSVGATSQLRNPKSWVLEGSDNGTDWTALDTQANVTDWEPGVTKWYTFANNTSYTYYRIRVTLKQVDGDYCAVGNLILIDTTVPDLMVRSLTGGSGYVDYAIAVNDDCIFSMMDSATTPAPQEILSSVTGTYAGWRAFSDVPHYEDSTLFEAETPSYVTIDFGSQQNYADLFYMIQARHASISYHARSWDVYISDDNTNWTLVDEQREQSDWLPDEKRYFDFDQSGLSFRYVKFDFHDDLDIQKIRIYEGTCGSQTVIESSIKSNCGAYPSNNEWDKYVIGSDLDGNITAGDGAVWNFGVGTFCRETPYLSIDASTNRVFRGRDVGTQFLYQPSSASGVSVGFRPVFEYVEANSLQTNLYY